MMKKNNNRILLVDNEPDIALAFKIGLEDNGFVVDTFNDPQIASTNFKDGLYDLLLLDIKMPKMTGIEFYQRMKKIDKKVKVCFISAYDVDYNALREQLPTLEIDCLILENIMRKPIEVNELIERIELELLT